VPNGSAQSLIARLEDTVASDESAFPALAEALRREGRTAEAERVARQGLERKPGSAEGSVALGLALLDQGRDEEARQVLETLVSEAFAVLGLPRAPSPAAVPLRSQPMGPLGAALTAPELDRAFAAAETDLDQLIDADHVAEEALRRADPTPVEVTASAPESPFATHTVADLLERQGDLEAASLLRASLRDVDRNGAALAAAGSRRQRAIAKLERWLENLRRPRA